MFVYGGPSGCCPRVVWGRDLAPTMHSKMVGGTYRQRPGYGRSTGGFLPFWMEAQRRNQVRNTTWTWKKLVKGR